MGGAADSAGAKLGMLAVGGIVLAGAALVGIGGVSLKMAGDFQQGVNRLVTGAGDVTDNMKKMGQAILGVSVATGVSATDLNAAMYLIISAHQRGAQAIDTLTVASKGAVIEQAKVADVANVLSGVMTNYGTKTFNATQYMNGLITAVQQGKITLQDLSVAMGPIDPIARQLGISFADMAAAMTTQTNAMIPSARAATGLRFMMMALENPTKKATTAMHDMGLSTVKVAEEMKVSLPGALEMIYNAAKRAGPEGSVPFNRAIADMIGGIRSYSAFMALTGPHMQDFIHNSQLISAAMQKSATEVIGWNIASQGFNVQLEMAKAALVALAIAIGQQLLPYMTQLVQSLIPLITGFTDWITTSGAVTAAMQNTIAAIQNTGRAIQNVIAFYQQWKPEIDNTAIAIAFFFTPAIIAAGVEAVISAAKITYNFIVSLIATGFNGWAAAAKLAVFIGSVIASGVQAIIAGGAIAVNYVMSVIAAAAASGVSAATISSTIIPALYAVGVAAYAALGPIGLVMGAVALAGVAFLAMKNQSDAMQLGVSGAFDTMGNKVQRSTGRIMVSADQMKQSVSNSTQKMAQDTKTSFDSMQFWVVTDSTSLSDTAKKIYDNMTGHISSDFSQLEQTTKDDFNAIAAYIDNKSALAANAANANFARIHMPNLSAIGGGGNLIHLNFASGTDSAPGGLAMVGERGPELMYIPRGAQIIPNNRLSQASSQAHSSVSSGQPVVVQFNVNGQQFVRAIMPDWVQAVRSATGAKF